MIIADTGQFIGLYLIIGVTFWFYPGSDPSGLLNQCTWRLIYLRDYRSTISSTYSLEIIWCKSVNPSLIIVKQPWIVSYSLDYSAFITPPFDSTGPGYGQSVIISPDTDICIIKAGPTITPQIYVDQSFALSELANVAAADARTMASRSLTLVAMESRW